MPREEHKIIASHMGDYLTSDQREPRIKAGLKAIKLWGKPFDAIAYRGQSGAVVASIIAHKLKKPLILVRKEGKEDKGHSYFKVEGPYTIKNYLIVDDFMSTGDTFDAIVEEIKWHAPEAVCLGMLEVTRAESRITKDTTTWEMKFSDMWIRGEQREERWELGTETEGDIHHLVALKQAKAKRVFEAKEKKRKSKEAWESMAKVMTDSMINWRGLTDTLVAPKFKVDHITQEVQFDFGPQRPCLPAPTALDYTEAVKESIAKGDGATVTVELPDNPIPAPGPSDAFGSLVNILAMGTMASIMGVQVPQALNSQGRKNYKYKKVFKNEVAPALPKTLIREK